MKLGQKHSNHGLPLVVHVINKKTTYSSKYYS